MNDDNEAAANCFLLLPTFKEKSTTEVDSA